MKRIGIPPVRCFVGGIGLLGLLACGGGGGGSVTNTPAATATGTFVDAPVAGLGYTSGTLTGVTTSTGQYTYQVGQGITFALGGIKLPAIAGTGLTTPMSVFNAGYGDTRVTNLARLLQTLGGGSSSLLTIPAAAQTAAAGISLTDFAAANFDVLVAPLVQSVGASQLVSAAQAQSQVMGNSIVGTWLLETPNPNEMEIMTFLPDGTELHGVYAPNYAGDPMVGFAEASYTWTPATGALSLSAPLVNNAGDWGEPEGGSALWVNNGTTSATVTHGTQTSTYTRLATTADPLVGTWVFPSGSPGVVGSEVVFLPGGYYMVLALSGPSASTGKPGLEYGTYTFASSSGLLTATPLGSTDGQWGMNQFNNAMTLAVNGNTMVVNGLSSAGYTGTRMEPGGSAATGTVQGTDLITWLPFDASAGTLLPAAPVPEDRTSVPSTISAVLADGSTVPGTYHQASGDFSIANVPEGYYWLQFGGDYLWTNQGTVSLDAIRSGRRSRVAASGATTLVFNILDMEAWKGTDYLALYDWNSNTYVEPWESGNPVAGSTALAGLTIGWGGNYLIDTAQGDAPQLELVETSFTSGTERLGVAKQLCNPNSLTMSNGGQGSMTGNFANLAPSATVYLNYSRSQFTSYRAQYNPNKTFGPWNSFIEIDSQPGAAAYGNLQDANWLDGLFLNNTDSTVTADPAPVSLAAPALSEGFERIAYAGDTCYLSYLAPGAASAASAEIYAIRSYTLTPPDATHPMAVQLSPARDPMINGKTLFSDQTAVGLTPTISWTAPATGTPTGYLISVNKLATSGGNTAWDQISTLYLDGSQTQTTLPAGLLATGNSYWFLIRAVSDTRYNPMAQPRAAFQFPYGRSETATNIVTP